MKKILIVVRGYYPELSASGNLMKPLIEELGKQNIVHILSCSIKSEVSDLTGNIRHHKIRISKTPSSLLKRLFFYIQKELVISYHNKEIVTVFQKEILNLESRHNYDIILAVTYEEILSLLNTNIPKNKKNIFLLEKLPISSNIPFVSNLKATYRKKIELRLIEEASRIYALPIMYDYLSKKFKAKKDKLTLLEHPMVVNHVFPAQNNSSKISLVYAGGLDRKQRNPDKIIDLFEKIYCQVNLELVFYSYGNLQKDLSTLANQKVFLFSNNAIDSILLEKEIRKANFIITIGNKETDIVPSKLFDCISTGKPILHFSQVSNDPYYRYLESYNNSLIVNYKDDFTDKVVNQIIQFLHTNKNTIIDYPTIEQNFKDCTPTYVAKKITSI